MGKNKSTSHRKKKTSRFSHFRIILITVLLFMIPFTILSLQTPKDIRQLAQTLPCDVTPTPTDTVTSFPTDTVTPTNPPVTNGPTGRPKPTRSPTKTPSPSLTSPTPNKKEHDDKKDDKQKKKEAREKKVEKKNTSPLIAFMTQLFGFSQNMQNFATPCITPTPTDTITPTDTPPPAPTDTPTPTQSQTVSACVAISVPAYFGTGSLWDTAVAGAPATQIMIANVNSGPGNGVDSQWTASINAARSAGILVLGYVATGHGNNSAASVKSQIDQWKQYYNVTSIHLDEAYAPVSAIPYYQDLTNYIHANGGISHLGVGDNFDEGFMQAADKFNIFEYDMNKLHTWTPASWVKNYPANRFGMDVFAMSAQDIPTAIAAARADNIQYVTLTDSTNPWNELATSGFWSTYVAAVTPLECAH